MLISHVLGFYDVLQEVIREYESTRPSASAAEEAANASGFDPEALAALPKHIRDEVRLTLLFKKMW